MDRAGKGSDFLQDRTDTETTVTDKTSKRLLQSRFQQNTTLAMDNVLLHFVSYCGPIGNPVILFRLQSPRGLRRGCVAARLLGLWLRIPPWAWISVSWYLLCMVM
jgi:hypothetical protein